MKKKLVKLLFMPLIIALVFTSCSISDIVYNLTNKNPSPHAQSGSAPLEYNTLSIDEASQNFYEYVNLPWWESTTLPSSRPVESTFSQIAIGNNDGFYMKLLSSIEDGTYKKDTDLGYVSRFFYTARDFDSRNDDNFDPILPYLDDIENVSSIRALEDQIVNLGKIGISSFYVMGSSADLQDSTKERLYIYGPSLGLDSKENYDVSDDNPEKATVQTYLDAYDSTLTSIISDITNDEAKAKEMSKNVIEIETALASALHSVEDASNPTFYYNPHDLYEFSDKFINANFAKVIRETGYENPEFVVVCEEDYHRAVDDLFTEENLPALKDFLYSKVLMFSSKMLSKKTTEAAEDLTNTLMGTTGYYPADSLAFATTYDYMGYFLGKIYVEENFTKEDRKYIEGMVDTIIESYKTRLEGNSWLTDDTIKAAVKKLDNMKIKVGHPKEWGNASDFYTINTYQDGGSVFSNVTHMMELSVVANVQSIDQPVYEDQWLMPRIP